MIAQNLRDFLIFVIIFKLENEENFVTKINPALILEIKKRCGYNRSREAKPW